MKTRVSLGYFVSYCRYGLKGDSSCLLNPVSRYGIGLVPGNVVMVAINMYGKSLREWIYEVM